MQWEFDFLHWNWEKLHGSAFWNTINKWLTAVGDAIPVAIWLTVIVVIMLFFKKTRKTGIALAAGVTLFGLIGNNLIIKNAVNRVRPIYMDADLLAYAQNYFAGSSYSFIPKETSASFMSGHSVTQFIIAFIIAYYHRKWAAPAIIFATLVVSTRLFFGFHYPSDIIAGIVYAALAASITIVVANISEKKIIAVKEKKKVQNAD